MLLSLAVHTREESKRHTFRCDPATNERQGKPCSGPDEAEVARKLKPANANANSVPVHGGDGNFPATENGERYFTSGIPMG